MNNVIHRKFAITNSINETITGDIRYPDNKTGIPCIIVLHGFQGYKDWGHYPYITGKFAEAGAIVVNFNFSLNGMIEGSDKVVEPEKFSRTTVSQELEDTELVVNNFINGKLLKKEILNNIWNGKIYMLGTSLGGGITILIAKKMNEINKIALWATLAKFDRYTERQKLEWKKLGYIEFQNAVTKRDVRLNYTFIEDIEKHGKEFSLPDAIAGLTIPVLFVHGESDVTVPWNEVQTLVEVSPYGMTEFHLIPNTGHTFGTDHPFTKPSRALKEALETTINFFEL
jgi:dienelactone hydrolase